MTSTVRKAVLPGVVAVGLVALAIVLRDRNRLPATPEGTVRAFFDAASRGDDAAYVRLVAGDLRRSFEQTRAEVGAAAFRDGLRRSVRAIKGFAISRRGDAPDGFVSLEVEIVFADRNERQEMLLGPAGSGWIITSIGEAQRVEPPVRYGTPVFAESPAPGGDSGSSRKR